MPQLSCSNLDTPGSPGAALFTYFLTAILHKQCEFGNIEYPADQFDHVLDGNIQIDFIVVGSGSSGSVIANRLSEISKWNILLIEAGDDPSVSSYMPALTFSLQKTSIDWSYVSEKQTDVFEGLQNDVCNVPRGKALGGSSNLNAMMYVVGNPNDYNSWGSNNWSFKNTEEYFHKSFKDYYYVGFVNRSDYCNTNEMIQTIMDASKDLNLDKLKYKNRNINPNRVGTLQIKTTIRDGERLNTARAFLTPIKDRTNLFVMKNTLVTKILLENKKATAVQILRDGKYYEIKFNKELILSAGTVNSPKLLFQSGIGDKKQLKKENVDLKLNLPSVGNYLYDHIMFVLPIELNISSKQRKKSKLDENQIHVKDDVNKPGEVKNFGKVRNESSLPEIVIDGENSTSSLFDVMLKKKSQIDVELKEELCNEQVVADHRKSTKNTNRKTGIGKIVEKSEEKEENEDGERNESEESFRKQKKGLRKNKKKHSRHHHDHTVEMNVTDNYNLPRFDEMYNYLTKKKSSYAGLGITDYVTFIDTTSVSPNDPDIMLIYVYFPEADDKLGLKVLLEAINWNKTTIAPLLNSKNDILLIMPMLLRPLSYGNISFTKNTDDNPKIFFNYFDKNEDLTTLLKSVRFMQKMTVTKSFKKVNAKIARDMDIECNGSFTFDSDDYWKCILKKRSTSYYHLSSTCRMGDDTKSSVVNDRLKVHGLHNVRVADASIMPYTVSANIHATCVMIGEKCADIVKQDWEETKQ